MVLLFLFVFAILPASELYLLIMAGKEIGGMNTLGLVLLMGIVGALLARSQGRQVYLSLRHKLEGGGVPKNELLEGVFIFFGGLLLIIPGFVTDVIGLSMVLPGIRGLWVRMLRKKLERAQTSRGGSVGQGGFQPGGGGIYYHVHHERGPAPNIRDVKEAEVIEITSRRKDL